MEDEIDTSRLKTAYAALLSGFFKKPDQRYLDQAADLGREMMESGVPPEEIAALHESAIRRLAQDSPERAMLEFVLRASTPLMEMLSAYGLAFRKQRDDLLESKSLLLESQSVARVGSYVLDIPAGVWESSPVLDGVFGIDENYDRSVAGWLAIVHPDDREMMTHYFTHDVLEKRGRFDKPYRIVRQDDGVERWVHGMGRLELDAAGNLVRMVGTIQDVTERKQAEETLKRSEEHFRAVVETAVNAIITIDSRGTVVAWNSGAQTTFGYSGGEVIGRSVTVIMPERYRDGHQQALQRAVLGGESRLAVETVELIGLRKNGDEFPMELSIADWKTEGEVFFTAILRDTSERKHAEKALWDLGKRLQISIDQMPVAYVLWDKELRILEWNPTAEHIFGYSKHEMVGTFPLDLIVPESARPQVLEVFQKLLTGEETAFSEEGNNLRKDGAVITCNWYNTPLKDETGVVIAILSMAVDITETLRLQAHSRQVQKLESIGRLAGGVAHDLNNLLTPILGYSEMLLDEMGPSDSGRESAGQIQRAGIRARDLVAQLLAFSRKQTLDYALLDMNAVITGFEKLLRRTIREDISIEIIPSIELPLIMADIGQIEQVIMNLSVNAQDAMPGGGTLMIETAPAILDDDYAAAHQGVKPGEFVMLAVSDTGMGMHDETREHLFEPFFSTKGDQGTGLGMATVYGIVKQHGGNIWVYSEVGKGTTIKVYLPASEEQERGEKTKPDVSVELSGSETILLVEDNEQVRDLAQAVLEQQGYTVLSAANGPQALIVLASHGNRVHLLLTDVVMPEMNGKELYGKVAEQSAGLKVLYMSGYPYNVIAHCGVLEEETAFIQKPFTIQSLAGKVRQVLDQA